MNLSLVQDIMRRNQDGRVLTPPGCCLTFVDHPALRMRRRMCVEIGIVTEHRFAFWLWMRVKEGMRRDPHTGKQIADERFCPPDLVTMDWHDDVGGNCDFIEKELLHLNQADETEVGLFCWAGLSPLNDGQIVPAVWLNAIGNVYAITRRPPQSRAQHRAMKDRYGNDHFVFYLRSPGRFLKSWQQAGRDVGFLWDIDLDYLTQSKEIPDQQYTPVLSDKAIAKLLDPRQEWVQEVLKNLRGISIALEPEHTGGLSRSLHLFRQWEKALFQVPLFDKKCKWRAAAEQPG